MNVAEETGQSRPAIEFTEVVNCTGYGKYKVTWLIWNIRNITYEYNTKGRLLTSYIGKLMDYSHEGRHRWKLGIAF